MSFFNIDSSFIEFEDEMKQKEHEKIMKRAEEFFVHCVIEKEKTTKDKEQDKDFLIEWAFKLVINIEANIYIFSEVIYPLLFETDKTKKAPYSLEGVKTALIVMDLISPLFVLMTDRNVIKNKEKEINELQKLFGESK